MYHSEDFDWLHLHTFSSYVWHKESNCPGQLKIVFGQVKVLLTAVLVLYKIEWNVQKYVWYWNLCLVNYIMWCHAGKENALGQIIYKQW